MIPDLVKANNEENRPICRVTNVRTICEILNSVSSSKTMFKQVCNLIKTSHCASHNNNREELFHFASTKNISLLNYATDNFKLCDATKYS